MRSPLAPATRRALLLAALVVAFAVVGLAAEGDAHRWRLGSDEVIDLVAGWLVALCGLVTWARAGDSRIGPLLMAAAAAWFVGTVGDPAVVTARGGIHGLAQPFAQVYVAILVHAVVTWTSGRVRRRVDGALVVAAYVATLVPALWDAPSSTSALGVALGVALVVGHLTLPADQRAARRPAIAAGLWLALALSGQRLVAGWFGAAGLGLLSQPSFLWAMTFAGVAVVLAGGLLVRVGGRARAADLAVDLVVDLDGTQARSPEADVRWVVDGRGGGRRVDWLDPELATAIRRAQELGERNDALRAALGERVLELEESRRRLLETEDAERGALQERLRAGAVTRLDRLPRLLGPLGAAPAAGRAADDRLERHLRRALVLAGEAHAELIALAEGLDPASLASTGLRAALLDLAGQCPIPVATHIDDDAVLDAPGRASAPGMARTLYFVASEGLANVCRHAGARAARLGLVVRASRVELEVEDDGVGGADPTGGTGLRGLGDRLATVGGGLEVLPGRDGGTLLRAWVPLRPEERP